MSQAYIGAASMIRFGKYPDKSAPELGREAIARLLADHSIDPKMIQAVYSGRSFSSVIDGQIAVPSQVALAGTGIYDIPVFNIENACAAAPSALNLATQAIRAGQCEAVLVVGMDKLYAPDRRVSMRALFGAMDVQATAWMLDSIAQEGKTSSIFMEHYYARVARNYLEATGSSEQDLAHVAVKNRKHASLNEVAQYRTPMTMEDVLASQVVASPLRALMCSPITDGAAAFFVCSKAIADRLDLRPVEVAASVIKSGFPEQGDAAPVLSRAARQAFEEAGVGPEDIDFAEVHDASAVAELIAIEQIGLAKAGEGSKLLREGATTLGGRLPVNPSGGLLSRGHPGAATGAAQLAELVWQLQARAGARQIEGASYGIAHSSGGLVGDEAAATAITILRH